MGVVILETDNVLCDEHYMRLVKGCKRVGFEKVLLLEDGVKFKGMINRRNNRKKPAFVRIMRRALQTRANTSDITCLLERRDAHAGMQCKAHT